MGVRITIDRGNTAIKGALWDDRGGIVCAIRGDESRPAADVALQLCTRAGVEPSGLTVAYCSVVASDRADDIASLTPLCHRLIDLNASTPVDMRIAYRTPDTLGADRIAAALGALAIAPAGRPLLVSDLGTAVTYDYVSADRVYEGGNIAPGVDLRLRALAAFTDTLPAVTPDGGPAPVWGGTTAEAMRSGAIRGVCAELEYYHRMAGSNTLAVLTGGSAKLITESKLITFDYIYDPCLVHKGLYSIIKDEK